MVNKCHCNVAVVVVVAVVVAVGLVWFVQNNKHQIHIHDRLLAISFNTIFEYLPLLKVCCVAIAAASECAMIVIAAAVSDFYLPEKYLHRNKIQSSVSGLQLQLQNVPKVLRYVCE